MSIPTKSPDEGNSALPVLSDFPPGTGFMIREFDVPLACIPVGRFCRWENWYGGRPRPYDVTGLKVDNNWPAESFEEWLDLIRASLPAGPGTPGSTGAGQRDR